MLLSMLYTSVSCVPLQVCGHCGSLFVAFGLGLFLGLRCVQMDSCGFLLLHYDVVFVCCFPLSGSLLSYYDVRSALGYEGMCSAGVSW